MSYFNECPLKDDTSVDNNRKVLCESSPLTSSINVLGEHTSKENFCKKRKISCSTSLDSDTKQIREGIFPFDEKCSLNVERRISSEDIRSLDGSTSPNRHFCDDDSWRRRKKHPNPEIVPECRFIENQNEYSEQSHHHSGSKSYKLSKAQIPNFKPNEINNKQNDILFKEKSNIYSTISEDFQNLDDQHETGVEKQNTNSDNISIDDDFQYIENTAQNYIDNDHEDISEESRLIQMNPDLRVFDVLDDLEKSDCEEGDYQQSNSSDFETDEEELTVEDVDAMLEEGLPDKLKESTKKDGVMKLKHKFILDEIGKDHFDLLPEGWLKVIHSSGMPVYLHKKTRVCTMARPYYLGTGSTRNHKVPLSAIPCLQYRRVLDLEKKNQEEEEEKEKTTEKSLDQSGLKLMPARIETFEENQAAQSLEVSDLREYCKKVFRFNTRTVIPFKSWADRRKYARITKDLKKQQRPSLPSGTKLLKFPVQNSYGSNSRSKGEWIINPTGKSFVCILHEYVQHALRTHPKYEFKELQNAATPFSATVFINEMQYCTGVGASKKQAKVDAAKTALEILIPEMKDKIEKDSLFGVRSQSNDISIFDEIKVEDPRVAEFCAKTTEPAPYTILLTCLNRNMGLGKVEVSYNKNPKKNKEEEFTMVVGNHTATVVCKNKREGKQRAAQAILQKLHPNITYWGSFLRMYGNRSIKNIKEKKQEEQEITSLQSKASLNQPNMAILEKLRTEMLKLKEKREANKAKGKFIPPENVILPSLSSTDLDKINL